MDILPHGTPRFMLHGTSLAAALDIANNGILPRSLLDSDGNWKGAPSIEDAVYLTSAYALYFAASAASNLAEDICVVIEIDTEELDPDNFIPDEDFLEQALRGSGGSDIASIESRTEKLRLNIHDYANPSNVTLSVRHMGTAAYLGEIPATAITRVAVLDMSTLEGKRVAFAALDAQVSVNNFRFCGPDYITMMDDLMQGKLPSTEVLALDDFAAKYTVRGPRA